MPDERAGLEIMAGNCRAEILDIKSGNAFAWAHGDFSIGLGFDVSY
jgi:hypothetical protein